MTGARVNHGATPPMLLAALAATLAAATLASLIGEAAAHDVSASNATFVEGVAGPAPIAFAYLGAKHMVTGLDHVLFLLGVIFYLRRMEDVLVFVSLFTLGHSLTLIAGVLAGVDVSPRLVDAVIGFSVAYKAFENIGGGGLIAPARLPDPRIVVFAFGLAHGLGLATKLQALTLSEDGLVVNLLSFNLGVEIGQALVLAAMLIALGAWRARSDFGARAYAANAALLTAGFTLAAMHLVGAAVEGPA